MTAADESRKRVQQKHERAERLTEEAKQAEDPDKRKQLQEEARRLESQCEQETAMRGGDIYPPL